MIKSIKHISRKQFNTINFYPVSNPPDPNSFSYISIYGNESYEKVPPRINHKLWFNGLQLKFDDVDEDSPNEGLYLISNIQADKVVNFLQEIHISKKEINLIVHCFAGVSRSAAVAKFTNDIFDLKFTNYTSVPLHNRKVYEQLSKSWSRNVDENVKNLKV